MRWDALVGEFFSEDDNDSIYQPIVESEENVDSDVDLDDLVVEDDAVFSDDEKDVDAQDFDDTLEVMKLVLVTP